MDKIKNIVILGAGFGGLASALGLEKQLRQYKNCKITLVDKYSYHTFNPSLYEVAASDEEFTSVKNLKVSTALPYEEILKGRAVSFVQAEVEKVDLEKRTVKAGIREMPFDYLVLATGSVTDYFGITGAKENSVQLKSLRDALFVRNQLAFAVERHAGDVQKPYIKFLVAGGGYTGCEFAAELAGLAKILAWKFNYPVEKIQIEVVEAANQLLPGLGPILGRQVFSRLKDLGVYIRLLSPVVSVEKHMLKFLSGESVGFDCLVWTTGVRAPVLPFAQPVELDRKGRVVVNEFLQVKKYSNVFAIGDLACVLNSSRLPVPGTAQEAIAQAKYVSSVLPMFMRNKQPAAYAPKARAMIISLGGKWAILVHGRLHIAGYLPYIFRRFANWRYYASIFGWFPALKYELSDWEVMARND